MKLLTLLTTTVLSMHASGILYTDALNLDDAIEILKSNNLELKVASYDIQSAEKDSTQAMGNHWGSLDFMQNIARSNDAGNVFGFKLTSREATFADFGANEFMDNFMACSGGNSVGCDAMYTKPPEALNYPKERDFFQSKVEYTLPLYVGGKISAYVEAADAMEELKKLDRQSLLNLKIYETRKAFYDMRLLEEAVGHLQTINKNIGKLEQMAKVMIKEGYAKNVDLLEVQAKRSNIERSINEMAANEQLLYHYLSFLLNQQVNNIELPATEAPMPQFNQEQIINHNVDVKRAETGLAIRRAMQDVETAGYLPMVGMKADAQVAGESFNDYSTEKSSYTVGLQLKWNLFNGGSDYSKVEKARIEALKTKTQLELAKKGIGLQFEKIITEILSLDFEIDALNHELELANTIYVSYEERYREQLSSMSDVIVKQSEQLAKVLELLKVKNKRNERVFALEKLANGVY
jgi:outer membrane protein